jgi:two-component system NtrC family response regulator
LVKQFIDRNNRLQQKTIDDISGEALSLMMAYNWNGNVRELENVIERVMILCPGDRIRVSDLPKGFKDNVHNTLHLEGIPADAKLYDTLAMIEKALIERALKMTGNVQVHAAQLLGIGKSGLNQKLKKYNLDVSSKQ